MQTQGPKSGVPLWFSYKKMYPRHFTNNITAKSGEKQSFNQS